MNKKLIALALVLALCLTATAGLAANSKTTKDIVTTNNAIVTVTAPTAESKAELDAIANFVNGGQSVFNYFGADVQSKITASLPAGVDSAALKMDEFFAMSTSGDGSIPASMTLSTAAVYGSDDAVIVLGGIAKNGKVEWQVLPCTIVGGKIVVTIPTSFTGGITAGSAMIAVLSATK